MYFLTGEYNHQLDAKNRIRIPAKLKKELGDCCWMIAEACTALGFDLEDVMQTNIDKLKKRFPNGFDVWRDQHRAKGDI